LKKGEKNGEKRQKGEKKRGGMKSERWEEEGNAILDVRDE